MKFFKTFNRNTFLSLMALIAVQVGFAQDLKNDDEKKAEIQNLVQSKNYTFVAQSVLPQSGRLINLTTVYSLKVKGGSVVSDLPYFGRAYTAPINPSEVGIHFTSTDFNYKVENRKKGGWEILIEPKDTKDITKMPLTIFENGYATLSVISNNRQFISYKGFIKEGK